MNPLRAENIRAVLFDFGGTLDSDGVNWKERYYPIYRRAGYRWSFRTFQKLFFEADDYLTARGLDRENFRQTLELQATTLLEKAGQPNRKNALKIAGEFRSESMKYIRRNLPLLRKLSTRYSLAILSNFYGNAETVCRDLKIAPYCRTIVDSTRAGYLKPDPGIFRAALKALRIPPEHALFVGDSVSRDMRGAKQLNMPHIWLKGKGLRSDSKTGKPLAPCCKNDIVIRSLMELEDILL